MKALIFSDSHGNAYYMDKAIALHPDAEVVFFLGDGLSDAEMLSAQFPGMAWLLVRGNCDYLGVFRGASVEKTDSVTLMGKRIVFTHGDLYGVKYGESGVLRLAESRGADIVLFGHTHTPFEKYVPTEEGGVYLFNPGSISRPPMGSRPSYGFIEINGGKIETNIVYL